MTVRAIVRLAVLGVLAVALVACSGADPTSSTGTSALIQGAGSGGSGTQRPEFHGARELGLLRGHQVTLLRACRASPRRHHLCAASGNRTYAAYGPLGSAVLTDAVMQPSAAHTSWLVRMTFAPSSEAILGASVRRATRTLEFVLVVDSRQRVLVPLDGSSVRRTAVTVGPVTKAEAWDLVSILSTGS